MTPSLSSLSSPPLSRRALARWAAALACTLSVGLLTACGGGGGAATDDSGSTGGGSSVLSYTSGAITGFGSIIVNGVRFDDSAASVLDDNGRAVSRSELKLGAHVEIEGGSINRSTGRASAISIRVGSEIKGPLAAVDLGASTLTVLGQTVEVLSTTVFDSSLASGLSSLTVGMLLEVHAQYDASRGVYVASRIEPEDSTSSYKLRGVISALDTSAKTFRVGSATINYSRLTTVPANLANGAWIKVRLATAQESGQWMAVAVDDGRRHSGDDRSEAEVKGYITAWTSATSFSVDGLPVDASGATFREGQAGVVLGARVEVEGAVVGGVLVATKVHLEDEDDSGRGEDYELHGTLSALNTSAKTFTLRGLTVDYSAVSDWRDLVESDLADGLSIEVKGDLSSDGTRLVASRISLED